MRRTYFVDTWFFVAFIDRRDSDYLKARRLRTKIRDTQLLTHEGVLAEVLAFFSDETPHLRTEAARIVREALRQIDVMSIDRTLFLRALDLYEGRPDKEYSLVDCMSMVVMRARSVVDVLTNYHHFRQERFTVVSDAP
jgi:predicted nucleic acid-binding protein